jgi:hypothetical protein
MQHFIKNCLSPQLMILFFSGQHRLKIKSTHI